MANMWGLVFTEDGISVGSGVFGGGFAAMTNMPTRGMTLVNRLFWREIDAVAIEGLDTDRVNKAALAGFGLLGVGAKVKQTGVVIRTGERELVFQMDGSEFDWKNGLKPLMQNHTEAASKIHLGVAPAESSPARENPIDQLERLGGLLERGLIKQDEYESMKREIIG